MTARLAKLLVTVALAVVLLTGSGCKRRGHGSYDHDYFDFGFSIGSFQDWFGGWDFFGYDDCYDGYSCYDDGYYYDEYGYGYDEWWKKKNGDKKR